MPHSSGGGSHGGGSHGGSHHSYHSSGSHSGSSSVPARHAKSVPFEGATRYVYYRKHKPVFLPITSINIYCRISSIPWTPPLPGPLTT